MLAPKSMPRRASEVTVEGSRKANGHAAASGSKTLDELPPDAVANQLIGWAMAYNESLGAPSPEPPEGDSEEPS